MSSLCAVNLQYKTHGFKSLPEELRPDFYDLKNLSTLVGIKSANLGLRVRNGTLRPLRPANMMINTANSRLSGLIDTGKCTDN